MNKKSKEKELNGYDSIGLSVGAFENMVPFIENNINMLWVYCQIRYIMMIEKYTTRKDLFELYNKTRILPEKEYEEAYNNLVDYGFIDEKGDAISLCK